MDVPGRDVGEAPSELPKEPLIVDAGVRADLDIGQVLGSSLGERHGCGKDLPEGFFSAELSGSRTGIGEGNFPVAPDRVALAAAEQDQEGLGAALGDTHLQGRSRVVVGDLSARRHGQVLDREVGESRIRPFLGTGNV